MKPLTDRVLLCRAFPEGYLAMRGTSTLGGWTCTTVDNGGDRSETTDLALVGWNGPGGSLLAIRRLDRQISHIQSLLDDGDLLPNLDPCGDPATWACVLQHLARQLLGEVFTTPEAQPVWQVNLTRMEDAQDAFALAVRISGESEDEVLILPWQATEESGGDPVAAVALALAVLRERA